MFERLWLLAAIGLLVLGARTANAGYLDENPDEVFESVYARLGPLPAKIARDPGVWVSLQELKREPCDQTTITNLALALEKQGYRREAATGLYKFVKACGAPAIALHRSIDIFRKQSDNAMAAEVADEFVKRWPNNHDAHYLRGTALAAIGDRERALSDFANAIELYPRTRRQLPAPPS
jgi:aspartyl protease family protein